MQALLQELSYASYLDVQTAIVPPPRNRQHVASYARALNAALNRIPYMQLSIRLPIYDPSIFRDEDPSSGERPGAKASESELNMCWEMWDTVRTLCDYSPRLTLGMLQLSIRDARLMGKPSTRLDATSAIRARSSVAMGGGAYQTCISSRYDVHCERQGISCSSKGFENVSARSNEGGASTLISQLLH